MATQAVQLRIPIDDAWDAGDRINVVTDNGTGTIDENVMLLQRAVELFPGDRREQGYGSDPYAVRRHDGRPSVRAPGHGDEHYGVDPYAVFSPAVTVTVDVPATFGSWKFAAVVVDDAGNVQGDPVAPLDVILSATAPEPPDSFAFASYDAMSDVITFNWS